MKGRLLSVLPFAASCQVLMHVVIFVFAFDDWNIDGIAFLLSFILLS